MRHSKHGFTLIELIIVIVIIGVLASIAAPMMSGMNSKAICTEAVTGLGALRGSLRQYYVEFRSYPVHMTEFYVSEVHSSPGVFPGIKLRSDSPGAYDGTFDGTYFSEKCYFVDPTSEYITCRPDGSTAPGSSNNDAPKHTEAEAIKDVKASDAYIKMYLNNGTIRQTNMSKSGYLEG